MPASRQDRWSLRAPRALGCLLLSLALGTTGCLTVNQQNVTGANDACSSNPCTAKGVCKGWTATCTVVKGAAVCSGWKVTGAAIKGPDGKVLKSPLGYQAAEASCDGKDNDCDGLTDESTVAAPADLAKDCTEAGKGVCADFKPVSMCSGGKWTCDFRAAPGYESVEASCDGKDNDCNDQVDENLTATAKDCKGFGVGVCAPAELAPPVCSAGAWDCATYYAGVLNYEAQEVSCDGLDNDCDGVVDANLDVSALAGTLSCASAGQCAKGVTAVCTSGKPTCSYAGVTTYEMVEKSCDGLDNDCDGITDNFAGGTLALSSADTSGCLSAGVCAAGGIEKVCKGGTMQCSYAKVAGHEAPESSCDAKDNDCDGATDNGLGKPAKSPCGTKGICATGTATCEAGLWTCNYTALKNAGYEAFEQSCDGLDNDCNGQTDETSNPSAPLNACKQLGACAYGVAVSCKSQSAVCDYSHVLGYEKDIETLCDGIDNDCDGQTDEKEGLDGQKSGCLKGICAASAIANCSAGTWSCDMSGVSGYEGSGETKCDGLDNDCDGQTDENLTNLAASGCPSVGVCQSGVTALCTGGKYLCNFSEISTYQTKEVQCDGLDNDCDGTTDVGVCGSGQACTASNQCLSGSCVQVTGGAKVCAPKPGQCGVLSSGVTTWTDDGASLCATTASTQKCIAGAWATASACSGATPQCIAGACVLCAPNSITCDQADKTKVVQCAADGKSVSTAATCATDTHCAGAGTCVADAAFAVSDAASASAPVGASLKDGGFALAWLSDENGGAEVRIRVAAADTTWKGPSALIAGTKPALTGTRVAIAPIGAGFAVAWVTGNANDADIALRFFDASGTAVGAPTLANSITAGAQTQPAMASSATSLLVAWSGDGVDGDGKGIAVRRFDSSGAPLGFEVSANDDPSLISDSATAGDQIQPAIAARASGEFAVVWTHSAAPAKNRVRGRVFGADGAATTAVKAISSGTGVAHQNPAIAYAQSTLVVTWASFNLDGSGYGIAMRRFDANLIAPLAAVPANTFTSGDQDLPAIAGRSDGSSVIVWQSVNAQGAGNGLEVAMRDIPLTGTLSAANPEVDLTKASPSGDQDMAGVTAFADGRVLYFWRSKATTLASGEIWALFR